MGQAGPARAGGPGGKRRPECEPEFTSYYGRPVIKAPVWEPRDIASYLFLGGLAGASSVLAAAATLTGRPVLARQAKLGAAVAVGDVAGSPGPRPGASGPVRQYAPGVQADVTHERRFVVVVGLRPGGVGAAASDLIGIGPGVGTLATMAAAVTGPAVASYTAVLIADTAVPAWHDGHRELPFVFVSSAAWDAAGWALVSALSFWPDGPAPPAGCAAGTTE